jgi:hypothetical protein
MGDFFQEPTPMSDKQLRAGLIRLAHQHPEFRKDLLPLLRQAADFPPDTIGEVKPGGSAEGVKGKGDNGPTESDASKPWMAGEFSQQENVEMLADQESGEFSDGKANDAPKKYASEDVLRQRLIRLAHQHPEFRKDLLPILTAGCEKLPEGGMRDNCEKKKEEGEGKEASRRR